MKLTTFFLILFTLQLSASGYSQDASLKVSFQSGTLADLIEAIETQSDFRIFYKTSQVNVHTEVSLAETEGTVASLLSDALEGSNISYQVLDRLIVLVNTEDARQGVKITGTVTDDETGEPLPGVNIQIEGTLNGTISNFQGKYELLVPSENSVLLFSYIGYSPEKIELQGNVTIDVALKPSVQSLEEVVVIGYGTTAKRNIASATTSLKSDDLVGLSTTDARQTLQGKIAGVQVVNNSGDPGAGARIVIRGMGSFTNTDPLYVIDGIQGGDINSVAPQDIEVITILKDASTTAIYGSAAANGVVLITTKSGKRGDIKVSYDGAVGMANVTKRLDLLNASQYVDLVRDIQDANGLEMTEKLESDYVLVDRTDWQEEVFQKALSTEHNLRLSGGNENVVYSFSAGYQNQGSTVIDRNFQRITIGAKIAEDLFNKKLRLNQNLRIRHDVQDGALANFNDALRMPPYIPIYDPDNLGGFGRADKVEDLNDANNPLNEVGNTDYKNRALHIDLDLGAEIEIYRGLTFKSQGRLSAWNGGDYTFNYPSNSGNYTRATSNMTENVSQGYDFILENFFSYSKIIGNHDIAVTLGNTYDPSRLYRSLSVAGSDFTSDAIQNVALANTTSLTGADVNSGVARLSYFGRLGYTFKEKYVINASLRRDASSKFGVNNRWGTFYGFGLAWIVTNEDFMNSISALSNLKIRASYGKTGNDNIPPFLTSSTVWKGTANNIVYSFGDNLTYANGSTINSIPNPYLKWEETNQFDIGFDMGFLNNTVNFIFDYYYRNNEDLLIETVLPYSTGIGNAGAQGTHWVNAASMKNSGFEAALSFSSVKNDFKWDLSLNATYSTNEVTALGTVGDLPISTGEFFGGLGNSTRTDIGHPLASYYGYVYDHVVVSQAELNELNAAAVIASEGDVTEYKVGMKPGDRVWKDTDGNGYINDRDRTYIGNPSPKWQYGAVFNGAYKNFDFQLILHGVADVDVINGALSSWEGMSKPFNSTTEVLKRWKQDGDITDVPAAGQNSAANMLFSDWYVEKGDYLRVKNLVLGYTLPQGLLKNTFEKLRIYVAVQNALTLTGYTGYDPEISSNSPTDDENYIFQRGLDLYQRPNPRIFRVGIQLNF